MSALAEIRHHIHVVEDTRKITRAMYLISSAKMKKAMRMHDQNLLSYQRIRSGIRFILDDLASAKVPTRNPYFRQHGKRAAFLVIAGDKGLCGSYNHDVLKRAQELIQARQEDQRGLFTVGHMASEHFVRLGLNPDVHYLHIIQNPSLHNARQITSELCALFRNKVLDEVYIVYTLMDDAGVLHPTVQRMLPVLREDFDDAQILHAKTGELTYTPSRFEVLDTMVPHYLVGMIYSALVQAYASEHRARMIAMDASMRNADEMLSKLKIKYGHARQAAITQELNEIVSGAPEGGL